MTEKKDLSELSPECLQEMSLWNDENVAFIKHGLYERKYMYKINRADRQNIAPTDHRDIP